jgi:hypothetical protein
VVDEFQLRHEHPREQQWLFQDETLQPDTIPEQLQDIVAERLQDIVVE